MGQGGEVTERGLVARGPWSWAGERFVAGLCTAGAVLGVYYLCSRLTDGRHVDLTTPLDRAIPFMPATAWVYFPCYVLQFLVGIFGIREREIFYRAVGSIFAALVVSVAGFLLVPSTMEWPPLPAEPGPTRTLVEVVRTLDVPNNTFPSLHVALSFCVAFGALRFRRGFGLFLLAMACVIAVSTVTAKHHYVVDSPGGIAVAVLAHWLAFRGWRG